MTSIYLNLLMSVGAAYGLPPGLLEAVCYVESGHRAKAYRHIDGITPSFGLCQVKFSTAKFLGFRGSPKQLFKPEVNAEYAARYLNYQFQRYGNWSRAIIAYNRGSSTGPLVNRYWRKVFTAWSQFKKS